MPPVCPRGSSFGLQKSHLVAAALDDRSGPGYIGVVVILQTKAGHAKTNELQNTRTEVTRSLGGGVGASKERRLHPLGRGGQLTLGARGSAQRQQHCLASTPNIGSEVEIYQAVAGTTRTNPQGRAEQDPCSRRAVSVRAPTDN